MTNKFKEISPESFNKKLNAGDSLTILDVREVGEYQVGHIEGSVNIPLGQVLQRYKELDKEKDIVVLCRSGNRSQLACEWLSDKGFQVSNLTGGLTAWKQLYK